MQDQPQNQIDRYRSFDEQELLAAAREYDMLTDEAQSALRDEFARRGMEAPLVDDAPRKFTTIRRYRNVSEAIVARSVLESAGIVVELPQENSVRLGMCEDFQDPLWIYGIPLRVDESDAAAATELLDMPNTAPEPLISLRTSGAA